MFVWCRVRKWIDVVTGSHSAYAVCKRFEVIEPHSCVEGAVCKNVLVTFKCGQEVCFDLCDAHVSGVGLRVTVI